MKKYFQLTLLAITVLICSCEKDDANADTASIQGTYKLTYLTAKTSSTITDDEGGNNSQQIKASSASHPNGHSKKDIPNIPGIFNRISEADN